jgi:hypothetical protein
MLYLLKRMELFDYFDEIIYFVLSMILLISFYYPKMRNWILFFFNLSFCLIFYIDLQEKDKDYLPSSAIILSLCPLLPSSSMIDAPSPFFFLSAILTICFLSLSLPFSTLLFYAIVLSYFYYLSKPFNTNSKQVHHDDIGEQVERMKRTIANAAHDLQTVSVIYILFYLCKNY